MLRNLCLLTGLILGTPWAGVGADIANTPLRQFGLGELRRAELSPGGELLVTFGQSGAYLWDVASGTVKHRLEGHRAAVTAAAFSPEGRMLVTAGNDGTIRSWDPESGNSLHVIQGHTRPVTSLVAVSAQEERVLSSAEDNTARIWDLPTGQVVQTFTVPGTFIQQALFVSNAAAVVTLHQAANSGIKIWDAGTGAIIREFDTNANEVSVMRLLPDGRLATGGRDQRVRVWDMNTGAVLSTLTNPTYQVSSLVYSPLDQAILSGGAEGIVSVWSYPGLIFQRQLTVEGLSALAPMNNAGQVLSSHTDNVVRVKDTTTGATVRAFEGHTSSTTTGVAFSPDGAYVISSGIEAATRVWRRTNAEPVRKLMGHPSGSSTVLWSPAGDLVLTTVAFPQKALQLWNAQTGNLERELLGHTGFAVSAAFSKDGSRVVSGGMDGTVRLWNTNGQIVRVFSAAGAWFRSVAISPDGKLVAGGGTDWVARLWDAQTGALLHVFEKEGSAAEVTRFSPDGSTLLIGWSEDVIETFELPGGKLKQILVPPPGFVEAAEYSPDGRFLLLGQGWPFFLASLWDTRSGELLRTFAGHTWAVESVAFNASSTQVLTGADHVRLWSIADLASKLQTERRGNALELRWGAGTLQRADTVDGKWDDVPGAISPRLEPIAGPSGFFRVRLDGE